VLAWTKRTIRVVNEPRDQRALRASDTDRERVADLLRRAASDGRLSVSELEERIEALYAAKTYGELEPVVADLPGPMPFLSVTAQPRVSANSPVPRLARPPRSRVGGHRTNRSAKAVFSRVTRKGQWIVPEHYYVKVVFGGVR
jgi:hypothetical protein